MDKIAVVVVETYSAKLVIANVVQDNYFSICDVEIEPIKFGLEMDDDHFLKKNQIMSIISTLKNFRKICDMFAVTKTIAIANFIKDSKPMNIIVSLMKFLLLVDLDFHCLHQRNRTMPFTLVL